VSISSVWAARVQIGLVPRPEGAARADAGLQRALVLDASLPEAHMGQSLPNIAVAPVFDLARGHPRFQALLQQLKLAP
jgi:hypothetical protein